MQPPGEFDLIARYFNRPAPSGMLGIGDDCALLSPAQGCDLAVSTDMLIEGRHFFSDGDPRLLGHKALAVNLSDLAAMGARPLACTLAISLPRLDAGWLQAFADGFHALSRAVHCPLIGGDTTGGAAQIILSITVMGEVRRHQALRRDAARVGDDVWISGTLGAADIALRLMLGSLPSDPARLALCRAALEAPTPRLKLGRYLAGVAHAAIDVSDGLLQDLGHLLDASQCAADLWLDALPAHAALQGLDEPIRRDALLAGGDAYELCFTAHPRRREQIDNLSRQLALPITRVGVLRGGGGLRVLDAQGDEVPIHCRGFDHFSVPHDT